MYRAYCHAYIILVAVEFWTWIDSDVLCEHSSPAFQERSRDDTTTMRATFESIGVLSHLCYVEELNNTVHYFLLSLVPLYSV